MASCTHFTSFRECCLYQVFIFAHLPSYDMWLTHTTEYSIHRPYKINRTPLWKIKYFYFMENVPHELHEIAFYEHALYNPAPIWNLHLVETCFICVGDLRKLWNMPNKCCRGVINSFYRDLIEHPPFSQVLRIQVSCQVCISFMKILTTLCSW